MRYQPNLRAQEGALRRIILDKANDYKVGAMPIERQKSFSKELSSLVLCFLYNDSPKYDIETYQIMA